MALAVLLLAAGAAPVAAQYRLAPSDSVRLKIHDWPDIAGEYAVDPEGTISLPVIGRVAVAGLGLDGLAETVGERLRQRIGSGERPVVAAEIARFRPFYIIGDVSRPGDYPWRPGLTVLQAVGLAGGWYRPPFATGFRIERDVVTAEGEIDELTLRLNRLLARAARLEAAVAGRAEIAFPDDLARRDDPALAAILDSERAALRLDREQAAERARALDAVRGLHEREIASLTGQIEALRKESDAVQRQLQEVRALAGRGLALGPNLISLERILAQNENERLGMNTAIVRAQANILFAEQRLREQGEDYRRDIGLELRRTRGEIDEARSRLRTAESLVAEALATGAVEERTQADAASRRRPVRITRRENGVERSFAAEDSTPVRPDDIIDVAPLPRIRRLSGAGLR